MKRKIQQQQNQRRRQQRAMQSVVKVKADNGFDDVSDFRNHVSPKMARETNWDV
ncbi:hypothetical protein [Acinetobacter sp. c3-l95]|uniref:hypothetical protein n=1 Tax=Acinetobacter sp. c3-l95 TaxID=3342804 RepID=UPI0035BB6EA2